MSHLLVKAVESGDLAKLRQLLDDGADIEWRHKGTGRTALLWATISNRHDMVVALLDRGANIDHQCKALGYTALAWASDAGALDIATLLIERGAALDLASPDLHRTALMNAAQSGHAHLVRLLLEAGANADLVDFRQQSAWSLAKSRNHDEIVSLLEAVGVGAPPPPEEKPSLAWPPFPVAGSEATADPATVVRAYTLAMHAWEQKGNALTPTGSVDDPTAWAHMSDPKFWGEQAEIVGKYCTVRPRAYQHASYGSPTEYAPDDVLVSVEARSKSQAQVVIRDGAERGGAREHQFIVKRVANEWRIDNVKSRLTGTETWDMAIL